MRQFEEPGCRDIATPGDVLQINGEDADNAFAGCFMVLTEIKDKYAVGYVAQPGRPDVPLYTRIKWENVGWVGNAHWVREEIVAARLKAEKAPTAAAKVRTKLKKAAARK